MTVPINRAKKPVKLTGEFMGERLTDDDFLTAMCPDTPADLRKDLLDATTKYGFGEVSGFDEYRLFRTQYNQIKSVVYREAGLTALAMYDKYRPIVEAAILRVTSVGDVTGTFMGPASSSSAEQWIARQIVEDTFGMSTADRIHSTGGTGTFHVVPRGNVGASPGTFGTTNDKQMLVIFYYQNDLNPRTVETIQENSNDDIGNRSPFEVYSQMQRGNEGVILRPGCLVIDDNKNIDIDAHVLQNEDVTLMPQGVDIDTRDNVTELIS